MGRCFLNHRYADDFKNHGVVSNSTAQGDQMDKTGESEERFWRLFNMNKVDTLELLEYVEQSIVLITTRFSIDIS